jgi:uncharacterized protein
VFVDPDRLFGRHLAVLGNTGSGKSCSVAGIVRWSLEQAERAGSGVPNARFIILDPNGEYSRAFGGKSSAAKARVFKVSPDTKADELLLQVPLWFWNSAEWVSFAQASTKTQKPTLVQALRAVREGVTEPEAGPSHELRRFLRTMLTTLRMERNAGVPWGTFPKPKSFYEKLEKWRVGLEPDLPSVTGDELTHLTAVVKELERLCAPIRTAKFPHYDLTKQQVDTLISVVSDAHSAFGGVETDTDPLDVDAPREFKGDSLVRSIEATAEMLNVSEYAETLIMRIRSLVADARMKTLISDTSGVTLEKWLGDYIGESDAKNGCVSVLDLSLVPTEVIHIVTAVIARVVFESLQRYRRMNGRTLPTVLVMEEAHTFVKRYREDVENQDASAVCCQVFERIAREGRKFGLGLVLSSQRPSELSPTVLSQCNTFLLHRISNHLDQELVQRLVPDNLKGLLRELPSLASQSAILLGWASELPVMVRMNDLPESQRPWSDDPEYWTVWTRTDMKGNKVERPTNWKALADEWQGRTTGKKTKKTS